MTPVIQDNPSGWGPCAVPEQFRDMPYQPFSKGDRLGKVADWTGATYQDKRYTNKYSSQFGGGSQYAYFHEEDETSFQLVDTARTQKTAYQRNRMRFAQRNLRRDKDRRNMLQFNLQTLPKSAKQKERERIRLQKKFQKQFGVRQKWDQKSQKPRDSSVEVRSDWEVKEEMDFPQLMKMRYLEVSEPQDIECCGALEYYDKAFDRITTRSEKPLRSIKRIFHTVTTTDDPVIRKLAKTQGNVFATDAILATLMSCTRSVYSWDIVVQRVGSKLFFDKRDNSDFDLLTVSETANEPPQDEGNSFNSPRNLAMEATYINHNFSQQCLRMGKERYNFPNPNPFVEDDMDKNEIASVAYRYRRWKLGDDIDLIVRCEHDGVMTGANGEVSFINIKTLNEWDSRHCNGVDWRQKLDSQRGAVIATELKNNSYKLARWTCCALLAGSEYLKLGYVSRYHVKDSSRHVILGTQQFKPNEFASQINLSVENAWGILRCVIDICMKLEEGKYLILKDPNKQVIRVYSLPDGTFSSDEDDEEEEEEEEEESEEELSDHDRNKDNEFSDEDNLLSNTKSKLLKLMSSSIDTGLNIKELGGLYINFNADKVQLNKRTLTQMKEKRKDELLQKTVITPEFEKNYCVPPYSESKYKLQKKRRQERQKTAGDGWFGMKAPELTDELKNDLKALKMRASMDPKRFYKKNDRDGFPKYFQIGTIVDNPADFYHSRVPKKQRKRTIVEELLADSEFRRYNRRKYSEIMAEKAANAAGKKFRKKKKFRN